MEERLHRKPNPKDIGSASIVELGAFPAWRLRHYVAHGLPSLLESARQREAGEEQERIELVRSKPKTLMAHELSTIQVQYEGLVKRYEEITGKRVINYFALGVTDVPVNYFYIEPLSIEEVGEAHQAPTEPNREPAVIIASEDLQRIALGI